MLVTCRDWLGDTFESDAAHGLLAPWVLHTGLGPDQATSGFMTQVIACALQLGGMPVPKGGGIRLVEGLADIVRDAGGELRTGADVERVLVSGGRASAVRLVGGETVRAERAIVASVTPTRLYSDLLGDGDVPAELRRAAAGYRYGRGDMQIHLALREPPDWYGDERLARTAIVHVTPGLDGVSRAVNEAERGLLPAEATIVCGQPMAVDPSRGPDGSWIVWIQLQELPAGRVKGDAAGEIDVGDGTWSRAAPRGVRGPHRRPTRPPHPESRARDDRAPCALPRRRRGDEPQPRRRRHLRRLVRARPELPLPTASAGAGTPHTGRRALAHRRLHASRAWAWARGRATWSTRSSRSRPCLGGCSRSSRVAREALALRDLHGRRLVRRGRRGVRGSGLRRHRSLGDRSSRRTTRRTSRCCERRASASQAASRPCRRSCRSSCPGWRSPATPSSGSPRSARACAASPPTSRSASSASRAPPVSSSAERAREIVVEGLREVAAAARAAGVRLGLEPATPRQRDSVSFVNSVADAVALLDEAGACPRSGSWSTPTTSGTSRPRPWLRSRAA